MLSVFALLLSSPTQASPSSAYHDLQRRITITEKMLEQRTPVGLKGELLLYLADSYQEQLRLLQRKSDQQAEIEVVTQKRREACERILKETPGFSHVDEAALCLIDCEPSEEANFQLSQAFIHDYPSSIHLGEAWSRVGDYWIKKGEYQQALSAYNHVTEAPKEYHATLVLERAICLYSLGSYSEAIGLLEQVLAETQQVEQQWLVEDIMIDATAYLAAAHEQSGDHAGALSILEVARAKGGSFASKLERLQNSIINQQPYHLVAVASFFSQGRSEGAPTSLSTTVKEWYP